MANVLRVSLEHQKCTWVHALCDGWDGYINIPADGGYTFHLLARDGARLVIDGMQIRRRDRHLRRFAIRTATRCASHGSIGLQGFHAIHLEGLRFASQGVPRVLWEGPSLPLTDVPNIAFSHAKQDGVVEAQHNDDYSESIDEHR